MAYRAPLKDMLFVMKEPAGIDAVARLPGFEDAGYDMAAAVLAECARFNEDVVAPLNEVDVAEVVADGLPARSDVRRGSAA